MNFGSGPKDVFSASGLLGGHNYKLKEAGLGVPSVHFHAFKPVELHTTRWTVPGLSEPESTKERLELYNYI